MVTTVDGDAVGDFTEFAGRIGQRSPGDTVDLTVVRGSQEQTVTVTLAAAPTS